VTRAERTHLAFLAGVTVVTAYFSYAYFHIDEYFQVLELVRYKNGDVGDPLAWEIVEHLRPWLQPALYYAVVKALGLHDTFTMAFVLRLVTGLANVFAVALLLRTTLPWLPSEEAKRVHLRLLTLVGFLPYLFVRTSSESASMAALTTGFALIFEGASPPQGENTEDRWTLATTTPRAVLAGLLFGAAFELRFQTAFASAGVLAWLAWRARAKLLVPIALGGVVALGLGALADHWGYGTWELTPWTYFKANILEGAAGTFGTELPFAYLWMSPANIFAPVVVALIVAVAIAWRRNLRHPLTAATLPFVVVHCLIGHKEERFLFPIIPLALALVAFGRPNIPARAWRFLAAWSFAGMTLLAFFPLGWHTHVRFTRFVHEHVGDDFHALATPEIELTFPAFRPRVYDIAKGTEPTDREWLIMDRPDFQEAPAFEGKATLVYSELPLADDPVWRARLMRWVDAYNAHAPPPLRKIYFRSLFRLAL
jgi:phosphatidylinositol glycan class B